jgi:hypothetical protein
MIPLLIVFAIALVVVTVGFEMEQERKWRERND